MQTYPTLIVEGKDGNHTMEVTWHLPPWSGKHMPITIDAMRYVLIDMTDEELDYLMELWHTDKKKYKASLVDLLDNHPCTFTPQ